MSPIKKPEKPRGTKITKTAPTSAKASARTTASASKKTHAVILPNEDPDDPDDCWVEVAQFPSQKAAIDYARAHYGADADGKISLIAKLE